MTIPTNSAPIIGRGVSSIVVEETPVSSLKPYRANARTHTKHQIRQIANSVAAFGFTNPILIDSNNRIVAGHGRLEAAKLLGMERVPTIRLEGLNEDQIRAYVLADNKLAENAGWDPQILAIELQYPVELNSADFDVTITGFEIPEVDAVIAEVSDSSKPEPPVPEPYRVVRAITQPGDVWKLDKHRIICANSLHEGTYRTLMGTKCASGVFTDPPFNVRIDGHATGNGQIKHREFAMASGEMSEAEFVSFLTNAIDLTSRYTAPNAIAYVCIDWRHVANLIRAAMQSFDEFANLCVWVKDNGGMGSFYRFQHELVGVFRKGKGPHRNNIQLGQFGRNRTNVWQYPGVRTMSKQGGEGNLLALHPTIKPIAMVADAILDSTARNEIVLDPFLGSGTTVMAAERVGRVCYGIEIDPAYVDVAINGIRGKDGNTKDLGPNPLEYVGVTYSTDGSTATLWEKTGGTWIEYSEIDGSSSCGVNVGSAHRGRGFNLSNFFSTYRWNADDGYANFSTWVS